MPRPTHCPCGSGEIPTAQHDGYNIFLCYTCSKCEAQKMAGFRADIRLVQISGGDQVIHQMLVVVAVVRDLLPPPAIDGAVRFDQRPMKPCQALRTGPVLQELQMISCRRIVCVRRSYDWSSDRS